MNQNQPLRELPLLNIEDLEYVYQTNFAGAARPPYDEEGDRYFNAKIDPTIAEALQRDGWNVKWTKPGKNASQEVIDDFVPEPYIVVALGFKFRPPTIIMIRNGNPTVITEKTVALLDSTEFDKIDCVIRARYWEGPNGSGYKAWLAEFYGTVELSDIGSKYAHLLDAVQRPDDDDQAGF